MSRPDAGPPRFEVRSADTDLDAAVRLADAAVRAHPWAQLRAEEISARIAQRLREKAQPAALLLVDGTPDGFATWSQRGPIGLSIELVYAAPAVASVDSYEAILSGISRQFLPPMFVPGSVAGLTAEEESRLMERRGMRPFGRSEMQRVGGAPPDSAGAVPGTRSRPVGPADEAELVRLHAAAYRGRFDRYLFLESTDEAEDSLALVRDLFGGRWGEFSAAGSVGVERDGRLLGAVLSVRHGGGTLIADVMVDPAVQGQGIGRSVLTATLAALDRAGESPAILNVTEGNARAQRLYAHLGFVRTLGPSREWYDPRIVPFPPDAS